MYTFYDDDHLRQLRDEAMRSHIDFTRAEIQPGADGVYTVKLDAPLFSLGSLVEEAPRVISARNHREAEGEMLTWVLRIQKAERQKLRQGRVFGWAPDQINTRPISADELDNYRADIAHRANVKKLQGELTEAIHAANEKAATSRGAKELAERYGLAPAKPVPTPANTINVPTGSRQQVRNRKSNVGVK